jgi:hypothetical protein
MSNSQNSGKVNGSLKKIQNEESKKTRETSNFFTHSRASSIFNISGESASLSSIT